MLEEYYKLKVSELLVEHEIKWGIEKNYRYLDFGGTPSFFNHGLFKFKERFGAEVSPILC